MRAPSGDQVGKSSSVSVEVSCRRPEPSVFPVYTNGFLEPNVHSRNGWALEDVPKTFYLTRPTVEALLRRLVKHKNDNALVSNIKFVTGTVTKLGIDQASNYVDSVTFRPPAGGEEMFKAAFFAGECLRIFPSPHISAR